MKIKYWIPFISFILPTIIITYFTWSSHVWKSYPKEELFSIIGLTIMWLSMFLAYCKGIKIVLKEKSESGIT